jgi:nucleolar protein 9
LNLYLLQRRPEEWRNAQSEKKKTASLQVKEETQIKVIKEGTPEDEPKKRKRKPENEIDELFDAALGGKIKKAALAAIPMSEEKEGEKEEDKSLKAVLGAIRSAPKGEEKHRKKRKKV